MCGCECVCVYVGLGVCMCICARVISTMDNRVLSMCILYFIIGSVTNRWVYVGMGVCACV